VLMKRRSGYGRKVIEARRRLAVKRGMARK
jgi:hypothetical protein